ncbi:hypothetical protein [Streptomyces sp. NRRL S-646]|uniref:hypothetical protein n=1 Tax=Streptomyces sp. NRRL S-646 TaxID=1463917 RepID=UPI0004CA5D3F|nr:hypothetical protein [Streptomyces sp. NRRL S-646]
MSAELQGGESSTMVAVRLRRVNRWLAPDRDEVMVEYVPERFLHRLAASPLGREHFVLRARVSPMRLR